MHLIRKFVVTAYHLLLETFVQIKENFGTLSKFLQVTGNMNKEFLDLINEVENPDFIRSTLNMAKTDFAAKDFNTWKCKTVLQKFSLQQIIPETITEKLESNSAILCKRPSVNKKNALVLFLVAIIMKLS